ncbi:hypothetical protein HPB47_011141, partial [Ixodes persulcatus]
SGRITMLRTFLQCRQCLFARTPCTQASTNYFKFRPPCLFSLLSWSARIQLCKGRRL